MKKPLIKATYNASEQVLTLVYYRSIVQYDHLSDEIDSYFCNNPDISVILERNYKEIQGLEIECPQRYLGEIHIFVEDVIGFKIGINFK